MTPDVLAVAVEDAVKALTTRAKLAGVTDPEPFAHEFIHALRRQGWRPLAPVTALPPKPNVVSLPPTDLIAETRAVLHAAATRHTEPEEGE